MGGTLVYLKKYYVLGIHFKVLIMHPVQQIKNFRAHINMSFVQRKHIIEVSNKILLSYGDLVESCYFKCKKLSFFGFKIGKTNMLIRRH